MFAVKNEYDGISSVLCVGCLCSDRKVVRLTTNIDLFATLLGVKQESCDSHIKLCWECLSLLKKVRLFQDRIQNAQLVLRQAHFKLEMPVITLSTLTIVRKDTFDASVDYEESFETSELIPELNFEIIKQENDDGDDLDENVDDGLYQMSLEDGVSDDEILRIDINKLKHLDDEPVVKHIKTRLAKKQSIRRYENKAAIVRLDVDVPELRKHCVKVYLTESEIESVLERNKAQWGNRQLPNECPDCKNSYKRAVDLKRHVTFNHKKLSFPMKCSECKSLVHSKAALDEHWRRHNTYYKCDLCGWLSYSIASITRHHHKTHTFIYNCKSCDASCSTLREFSTHYKENHERIICDHCGKSFRKKRTLEVHIKRNHMPATCFECNKTYSHYHVLENHYRMYHPHLIRADNRTELAYCVECDKQFTSVYKFKRHLATAPKHTPQKPVRIPCPECGKVFARKIRMTDHYKSVHVNTTKHRCELCNKTFCSAYSARTHRQHVHDKIPKPKNKMCDICGRGFHTNRILANHRRTHTGERPYKCVYCPATFAQRTAMKTHEKSQHKTVLMGHS